MVQLDTEHGKDPLPAVCQRSLLRRLVTLDELGDSAMVPARSRTVHVHRERRCTRLVTHVSSFNDAVLLDGHFGSGDEAPLDYTQIVLFFFFKVLDGSCAQRPQVSLRPRRDGSSSMLSGFPPGRRTQVGCFVVFPVVLLIPFR